VLKRDYFIAAMKAGCYKYLDWATGAFCLTKDTNAASHPLKLIVEPTTYQFKDNTTNSIMAIEDAVIGQPLFSVSERLDITPEDIPNLDSPITTTYGNLLVNYIILVHPFGRKIKYINDKVSISKIHELILPILKDTPENNEERSPEYIYIDEYIKFADNVFFLTGFSQVCTWAATRKIMLPPPGAAEYKAKLFREYAGKLNQASAIAEIDAKLIAYDKQYLKGDPGLNFLISKKSIEVNRKKKFLMIGGETGLDGNSITIDLVKNSLDEGWDIKDFPVMNDSLRIKSYSRGAETMLGGVEVKWLLRASSNINITEEDCKSNLGRPSLVQETNFKKLKGFSIVTKEGSRKIVSDEDAASYIGRRVMVRSPMYCKLTGTDYCSTCIGERLSINKDGLSISVSQYGSSFLNMMLKSAHSSTLSLAKMNYRTALT